MNLRSERQAARALLPLVILCLSACNLTRGAEDAKALRAVDAKFTIVAPCPVASAQAAVEGAARGFELDLEEASQKPGDPWVFRRGARLVDPPLLYRVDVVAKEKDSSLIRVYAVPVGRGLADTQETLAKPGALAMRIVAACAAGGAR